MRNADRCQAVLRENQQYPTESLFISIWLTVSCPHSLHCRWAVHPVRCSCEHLCQSSGWHIAAYYCWIVVSSGRPTYTWLLPWKQNTNPQATGCHLSLQCKYYRIKTLFLVHHTKLLRVPRLLQLLITSCASSKTSGKWRDLRVNFITRRYFLFWSVT